MSVLIKNMEMPECCYDCPLIRASVAGDYYCAAGNGIEEDLKKLYERRMPDCPLVEIKTPHGDLADKDKLMQEFMDSDLDHLQRDDWREVIQIVSDAEVVIEAEGSEE